jgi:hypothetical protein
MGGHFSGGSVQAYFPDDSPTSSRRVRGALPVLCLPDLG